MTMFAAKFHLVSKSTGLYLGVSGEDSLVTQERTCRNTDSLLWQWQGSHLVSQEGRAMAGNKAREGKDGTITIDYNLAMLGAKQSWNDTSEPSCQQSVYLLKIQSRCGC